MPIKPVLRKLTGKFPWNRPNLKGTPQPFVGLALALAADDLETYPYLSFGIGCFHFGADDPARFSSAKDHVEAIQQFLSNAPFVSNVQVSDQELGWFESIDLPYGLALGGQPFPAIRQLRVDFQLEVSIANQQSFYPWFAPTEPAIIDVSIRQGWRFRLLLWSLGQIAYIPGVQSVLLGTR